MTRARLSLLFLLLLTGACTQFPELDSRVTPALEAAPYPALLPLAPVLASARTPGTDPQRATGAIDARVTALRARAARLRAPVLSSPERQRLAQAVR